MSSDQKTTGDMFDIIIDDILDATDEEIIAEALEDGIDIDQEVYKTKSIFNKCRYNSAKKNIESRNIPETKHSNVISIEKARLKIQNAIAENPEVLDQFTMAARFGETIPDEDVMGYYEDFCELGFFSEEEAKEDE